METDKEAETLFEAIKNVAGKVKKEYNERIDPATTGEIANQIKKYAKYVFIASSLLSAIPVTLPASILPWLSYIVLVSGVISGMSSLDKSKIK